MGNVFEVSVEELSTIFIDIVQSMSWADIEKARNALPKHGNETQWLWSGCVAFLQENKDVLIRQMVNTFFDMGRIGETAKAIVEESHNEKSATQRLADVKCILNHLIKSGGADGCDHYAFRHGLSLMEMEVDDLNALYGDVLAGGEEHDTAAVGVASQEADSESV